LKIKIPNLVSVIDQDRRVERDHDLEDADHHRDIDQKEEGILLKGSYFVSLVVLQ